MRWNDKGNDAANVQGCISVRGGKQERSGDCSHVPKEKSKEKAVPLLAAPCVYVR